MRRQLPEWIISEPAAAQCAQSNIKHATLRSCMSIGRRDVNRVRRRARRLDDGFVPAGSRTPMTSQGDFAILAARNNQSIEFMIQSARAMLSASDFLLVASTAARTSECDQPPPVILRRSAHPQPRTPRPAEARRAALEPLRAPFRETQLGSAQLPFDMRFPRLSRPSSSELDSRAAQIVESGFADANNLTRCSI
jgi:hypothetical protein